MQTSFYLIGKKENVLKSAEIIVSHYKESDGWYFLKDDVDNEYHNKPTIDDIRKDTANITENIEVWLSYNESESILHNKEIFSKDNFSGVEMIVKIVDFKAHKVGIYETINGEIISNEYTPMIIIDLSNIDTYYGFRKAFAHDHYISNYISMDAFKEIKSLNIDEQTISIIPKEI